LGRRGARIRDNVKRRLGVRSVAIDELTGVDVCDINIRSYSRIVEKDERTVVYVNIFRIVLNSTLGKDDAEFAQIRARSRRRDFNPVRR
jgi:hypothetical protein